MAKRAKLTNVGEAENINAENEIENSFTPESNPENENQDAETEQGETEQDRADREAAGIPDKPTRAAANGSNAPRETSPRMQLNAVKRAVQGLGAQHGAGKTSMIALAEVVTEAAQDNVITPELVGEIYDKFREGVNAKSQYEDAGVVPDEAATGSLGKLTEDKSREQQLSKLRRFIFLGNKYDVDALDLIRRARNMHIDLLRQALASPDSKKGIKPGSTYSVLVDVARAQLKKQADAIEAGKKPGATKHTGLAPVLTDDELRGVMTQEITETAPLTSEEKLLQTYLAAISVRDGTPSRGPLPSEALDNAIEWLKQALATTAPEILQEHEDGIAKKAQDDAAKAKAKEDREAEKARKAAEPKAPKESKADRQAKLATVAAEAAA